VAMVGKGDRLGVAFGLIVDAPHPYRVDVAAVVLCLGMDQRVAIDLRRGGEHEGR
jgi:hypothetical protein